MVNDSEKPCYVLSPAWLWRMAVALFLCGTVFNANAANVTGTLDRAAVFWGDNVNYTISFNDCSPIKEPVFPKIPGIECVGTSSGSQMTINNNVVSQTLTLTFTLRPTQVGEFNIPAIKVVTTEKQTFATTPCVLKVVKDAEMDGNLAFAKIVPAKNRVFVGESVLVEIHGYCRNVRGKQAQSPQLAPFTFEGVNAGSVVDYSRSASSVSISNGVYFDVVYRLPVVPTKAGKLTLGPVNWTIHYASGRRDFFGNSAQVTPVPVTSDIAEIEVIPLPSENVPASFSGAIGHFSLDSFEAAPTNVAAGDPVTIKWRIAGRGNFDSVLAPSQQDSWREFKLYAPTSKFDTQDQFQIEGAKYFEMVVTPQNTGVKELPPFQFSFFDPDKQAYRVLSTPAVPLTVRPTAATPQPTVFVGKEEHTDAPPPAQEIVHIRPVMGTLAREARPWVQSPGFWALQCVAPLIWLGSVIWRRQKEKLAANPRLRRQREVSRLVEKGLEELRGQVQGNQQDAFYAGVFRLLQLQVGERLDLPSTAITEAALEELNGLDGETLADLKALFQACNQYRYAPQRGEQELNSLLEKLHRAIKELKKLPDVSNRSGKTVGVAVALGLLAGVFSASAADESSAFVAANKLYEEGKYSDAAAAYKKILDTGMVSPALYFNYGNAAFKASHSGQAIWAYRKAELMAPRDSDIRANLQFARNHVGQSRPTESVWLRGINRLSVNEWSILTSMAVAVLFLLLAARQTRMGFSPTNVKPFTGLVWGLVVVCVIAGGGLWGAVQSRVLAKVSVVVVPESVVRRGPMMESPSVFTLRDGAEVEVVDVNNDWVQVVDALKHTGWMPVRDLVSVK